MEVRVAGHQVDTGEWLQDHVTSRMSALTEKYFARAVGANVTFGRGPHDHGFTCDIVAPVANGVVLKAHGSAPDAQIAFEPVDEEQPAPENPPVVAETRVDIPEITVGDAVMQLDLRNTNALMFRNTGTGEFNMVYRRGDGTIGWVEPRAR